MLSVEKIKSLLKKELSAKQVELIDNSEFHKGHSEAKISGGGHYEVKIVSDRFKDMKSVDRHRMVYRALREELKNDIHALAIVALTPEENKKQSRP